MKIFVSWSGRESLDVAKAVQRWLRLMFHSVDPWLSNKDISVGDRSMDQIQQALVGAEYGILCITAENQNSIWVNFEAGAISNTVGGKARVTPLLIGFTNNAALSQGPLAQFHTALADRQGFDQLAKSVNEELGEHARPADEVAESMDLYWPRLEDAIADARRAAAADRKPEAPMRDHGEMIEEILGGVRTLLLRQEKGTAPEYIPQEISWRGSGEGDLRPSIGERRMRSSADYHVPPAQLY